MPLHERRHRVTVAILPNSGTTNAA